jgi:DNA-binding PadR family transcriptional regulator
MALSSDLLRGYTEAVILRRLLGQDGYGYQISKEVAEISRGRLEMKEATLYTAFRRLEAAGCIESYWGNEVIGARRRYYRLTEEGARRLQEDAETWLETREVLDALLLGTASPEAAPEEADNSEPKVVVVKEEEKQ